MTSSDCDDSYSTSSQKRGLLRPHSNRSRPIFRNLPLFAFLAGLVIVLYVFHAHHSQSNELHALHEKFEVMQASYSRDRDELIGTKTVMEQQKSVERSLTDQIKALKQQINENNEAQRLANDTISTLKNDNAKLIALNNEYMKTVEDLKKSWVEKALVQNQSQSVVVVNQNESHVKGQNQSDVKNDNQWDVVQEKKYELAGNIGDANALNNTKTMKKYESTLKPLNQLSISTENKPYVITNQWIAAKYNKAQDNPKLEEVLKMNVNEEENNPHLSPKENDYFEENDKEPQTFDEENEKKLKFKSDR